MPSDSPQQFDIAVVLPCHNEEAVIAGVVKDFQSQLPEATVYVIDNVSTDRTAAAAKDAGARIIHEDMKGKGHAVRRAFSDIDADVYLMADGDGTYDASRAREMIDLLVDEHLDMVVGTRRTEDQGAYRFGHRIGNYVFNILLRFLFGKKFSDIFSGYRVFSRRFVKSFPAFLPGFEIETEMSVHAIQMGIPTREVETDYFARAAGSVSKIKTYQDGLRILLAMLKLMKHVRPMAMFSTIALFFVLLSLAIGIPVVMYFLETHTVPRIPTTIAASGLMILGAISFVTGLVLDGIAYAYITYKRLAYLSYTPIWRDDVRGRDDSRGR